MQHYSGQLDRTNESGSCLAEYNSIMRSTEDLQNQSATAVVRGWREVTIQHRLGAGVDQQRKKREPCRGILFVLN